MWHGLLNIHKERGCTSHRVVADIRRILGQKDVGHTGTLDPEASGVLVVGLGQGTRSFPYLHETTKLYRAEIVLGQTTDTQDATGTILSETPQTDIPLTVLEETIAGMKGDLMQTPPMYSAVKIAGQKLYDLARRGMEVERPSRPIKVLQWTILNPAPRYGYKQTFQCEILCSRGTYIRTLIHDLGQKLGCGAHMGELVRLKSGDFSLDSAVTLEQVRDYLSTGSFPEILIPINTALQHLPALMLEVDDVSKVTNGGKISYNKYPLDSPPGTFARGLDHEQNLVAIVSLVDAGSYYYWQPVTVFKQH